MIATMTGDLRRAHGLFLGLAEDPANRPALQETIEFLGLIDLQETVIGRKARNTGHKAIRARAVTDLANYIGWEKSHGVFYMGVPDMAVGPLYYSLYDAASVRINAEFPEDGGKNLRHTNKDPAVAARGRGDARPLDDRRPATTVWDLISAHLKSGKSIKSLGDTIQIGAAELILRTTVPRQFTNGQHPFDYCNVASNWMRNTENPYQARILYLMANFINDVAHENKLQTSVLEQEGKAFDFAGKAPAALLRRARRGDHGARLSARDGGGQGLSRFRRRPAGLHGNRRARRLPVSGRPAQPEDHDLDLRGVRPKLDASARQAAAGDARACSPAGSRCRASATASPASRRSGSTTRLVRRRSELTARPAGSSPRNDGWTRVPLVAPCPWEPPARLA